MNTAERQALREAHQIVDWRSGADYSKCGLCNVGTWPCDTIKVLDAWEADKCDHKTVLNGVEKTWWFSCPKCNEMLV